MPLQHVDDSTTEATGPTSECRRQCHKQSVWPSRLEHTRTRSRTAMQNCPRHGKWNWFRGRFLAKHEDASMLKSFALPLGIFPERKKYSGRALADLTIFIKKKKLCFRKDCHSPKAAMQSKAEERKWKKCIFNFAEKNMLNIGTPCSLKSCFWKEGVFFKENEMRMLAASCRLAS